MKTFLTVGVAVATSLTVAGCGMRMPSERTCYTIARQAVSEHDSLPEGATFGSIDDAELYICKSAGRVDLPVTAVNEAGQPVKKWYTVWLKRVARTWTLERCIPSPVYPVQGTTLHILEPAPQDHADATRDE